MTVDVPKLMNALVADLQSDAWDNDVKLVLDASTRVTCPFDATKMRDCLSALLARLIRGTQPDGTLSVVTACEAGTLQITIAAPVARSFDFNGLRPAFESLVQGAQGTLAVGQESADFWTLTLALPNAVVANAPSERGVAIVVDDDVDMQDFLTIVLESRGFRVVAVNDGFDALIAIERYQPVVVLTDIVMPNMSGLDLIGRIKGVRADLPVIVFSGYQAPLTPKQGQESPSRADYVLPKPMTQLQVLAALDTVLTRSGQGEKPPV